MSDVELNSLSNFWICYEDDGNITSVSDYFLDKVNMNASVFENFQFKRFYKSNSENKLSKLLANKVFEVTCLANGLSFRFTSHKISGENVLKGWPKLEELNDISEYKLQDPMNHPCCLMTDILIMKDLIKKEQDLALHKESEAHQKKLSTISQLASGVGHEINNPLMVIKAQTIAIRKKMDNLNDLEVRLEKIDKSIERISLISSRLRDFSKIGSDQIKKININQLVSKTCKMLSEVFDEDRTIILCNIPDREIWIRGDESRIQICIIDLLKNAKDAMELCNKREIKIDLKAENDFCSIYVQDEGCGVPEDIREKIFDPFYTTKEINKGTGIGLALVREIIRDHKGHISFETKVGEGTTFKIEFPLVS